MYQKNLSVYRLAKNSGIPYTTVSDICSGRARLEKCSAETVYRLSRELDVSVEELLEPLLEQRISFELYKSNVCHRVKELGDIDFIIETLEQGRIRSLYNKGWYPESLYLLAMLDYISRVNGILVCEEYEDLRRCRLREPIYPASVLSLSAAYGARQAKEQLEKAAIPEFMRFNIVEAEVRDVI